MSSSKRYITVPVDVIVRGPNGKPLEQSVNEDGTDRVKAMTFSFKEFIQFLLNDQERFGSSGAKLRLGARIDALTEPIKAGDTLVLDEDDWRPLHAAADEPKMGYPVLGMAGGAQFHIGRQLIPFIDALNDPPNRPPEKKEAESEEKELPS